jgi:hypothetical protein
MPNNDGRTDGEKLPEGTSERTSMIDKHSNILNKNKFLKSYYIFHMIYRFNMLFNRYYMIRLGGITKKVKEKLKSSKDKVMDTKDKAKDKVTTAKENVSSSSSSSSKKERELEEKMIH